MKEARAFEPFALEKYQSDYEHAVEINLADSGVKCLRIDELVTAEEHANLAKLDLYYPEVNGVRALREAIAAMYQGADADNVLVTVGAAQANLVSVMSLIAPGDEVVVISPGYRQVWGLARNAGAVIREAVLDSERAWRLDLDALEAMINPRTRLVAIVNPNNPSGSVLSPAERKRIIDACERVGAWLHADEVYAGTEHTGELATPSFWGSYDKLICVNSLSKAYGLSGLRIGWAVADHRTIQELWRRHEYATIAASGPSMALATLALEPARRAGLIARQRQLTRDGRKAMEGWIATQKGRFSLQPSAATSLTFVRAHTSATSFEIAEKVRRDANVLVGPGAFLGAEHHLRISTGYDAARLMRALARVEEATASFF